MVEGNMSFVQTATNLGYSPLQIENLKNNYKLICYSDTTLEKRILDVNELFLSFGYSKNDIIKMICSSPLILALDLQNLTEFYAAFSTCGYTQKETFSIFKKCAVIFTFSIENIRKNLWD